MLLPRRIASMQMLRLVLRFRVDAGTAAATRERFMRNFDLYPQRGGG